MPRTPLTITPNSKGFATTQRPLGTPNPTGVQYYGNPVDGQTIHIVSDGSVNFGPSYNYVMMKLDLAGQSPGSLELNIFEKGQQVDSLTYSSSPANYKLPLIAYNGFRGAVGIGIGNLRANPGDATITSMISAVSKFKMSMAFTHTYYRRPAANAANLVAAMANGTQVKNTWYMFDTNGGSDAGTIDSYFSPERTVSNSTVFAEPQISTGNKGMVDVNAPGSIPSAGYYQRVAPTSNTVLDEIISYQDFRRFSTSMGYVHSRMWGSSSGLIRDYGGASNATAGFTLPDQIHWPGNVQGNNDVYQNRNSYDWNRISLAGDNAWSYWEIRDGATKATSKIISPCMNVSTSPFFEEIKILQGAHASITTDGTMYLVRVGNDNTDNVIRDIYQIPLTGAR